MFPSCEDYWLECGRPEEAIRALEIVLRNELHVPPVAFNLRFGGL
jgi:hypothetical protein